MKTEALTVLRDLCEEVVSLRKSTSDLGKLLDAEISAHKETSANLRCEEDASNGLREREASLLNANAELNAELLHTKEELDDARRKLGEWARFINFGVYERMNKFVPKGKSEVVRLRTYVDLVDEVLSALEKFQKEHPITIIEEGQAK